MSLTKRDFWEVQRRQKFRSYLLLLVFCAFYFMTITTGMVIINLCVAALPDSAGAALTGLTIVVFSFSVSLLIVAIQMWFALNFAVVSIEKALRTIPPDMEDRYHRRFKNIVNEMAVAAGYAGKVRAVIMPSMVLSAFAAEDRRQGKIVGVTEGLLSHLNRDQLQACVGHEMAHIRHGDARLAALVCAMQAPFLKISEFLESISKDEPSVSFDIIAMAPAGQTAVMVYTGSFLAKVQNDFLTLLMRFISTPISRKRELMADAGSAEFTRNPLAMAEALEIVAHRNHFLGGQASAYAPIFIVDSTTSPLSRSEGWFSDLFSSHPPLEKRVQALIAMGADQAKLLTNSRLASIPSSSVGGDQWNVQVSNGWSRPMSLEQLMKHPGIGPDSWLIPQGVFAPFRLRSHQRLARVWATEHSEEMTDVSAMDSGDVFFNAPSQTSKGSCPHCLIPMHRLEYEGVMIEGCMKCRGLFVEENKISRILCREENTFSDNFIEQVRRWKIENPFRVTRPEDFGQQIELSPGSRSGMGRLHCPHCSQEMVCRFYNYQHFIVVDRCYNCKAIWFDHEEIETLQVLHMLGQKSSV